MTLRLVSWNVCGLRAAHRKGFAGFVDQLAPDILALQEIRALPDQLTELIPPAFPHLDWHPAEKKGYSGVATWSRDPHQRIGIGVGAADPDGRVLRTHVRGVEVINVYLPSGSAGPERQKAKDAFCKRFLPFAKARAKEKHPVLICGDLNIAHTEHDIHNPTGNKKNSGFLPHEREWFGKLLKSGYTDAVRLREGPKKGPYSWWSNRGQARVLDRGWRIDYWLANSAAAERLGKAWIWREAGVAASDHAPVIVELQE